MINFKSESQAQGYRRKTINTDILFPSKKIKQSSKGKCFDLSIESSLKLRNGGFTPSAASYFKKIKCAKDKGCIFQQDNILVQGSGKVDNLEVTDQENNHNFSLIESDVNKQAPENYQENSELINDFQSNIRCYSQIPSDPTLKRLTTSFIRNNERRSETTSANNSFRRISMLGKYKKNFPISSVLKRGRKTSQSALHTREVFKRDSASFIRKQNSNIKLDDTLKISSSCDKSTCSENDNFHSISRHLLQNIKKQSLSSIFNIEECMIESGLHNADQNFTTGKSFLEPLHFLTPRKSEAINFQDPFVVINSENKSRGNFSCPDCSIDFCDKKCIQNKATISNRIEHGTLQNKRMQYAKMFPIFESKQRTRRNDIQGNGDKGLNRTHPSSGNTLLSETPKSKNISGRENQTINLKLTDIDINAPDKLYHTDQKLPTFKLFLEYFGSQDLNNQISSEYSSISCTNSGITEEKQTLNEENVVKSKPVSISIKKSYLKAKIDTDDESMKESSTNINQTSLKHCVPQKEIICQRETNNKSQALKESSIHYFAADEILLNIQNVQNLRGYKPSKDVYCKQDDNKCFGSQCNRKVFISSRANKFPGNDEPNAKKIARSAGNIQKTNEEYNKKRNQEVPITKMISSVQASQKIFDCMPKSTNEELSNFEKMKNSNVNTYKNSLIKCNVAAHFDIDKEFKNLEKKSMFNNRKEEIPNQTSAAYNIQYESDNMDYSNKKFLENCMHSEFCFELNNSENTKILMNNYETLVSNHIVFDENILTSSRSTKNYSTRRNSFSEPSCGQNKRDCNLLCSKHHLNKNNNLHLPHLNENNNYIRLSEPHFIQLENHNSPLSEKIGNSSMKNCLSSTNKHLHMNHITEYCFEGTSFKDKNNLSLHKNENGTRNSSDIFSVKYSDSYEKENKNPNIKFPSNLSTEILMENASKDLNMIYEFSKQSGTECTAYQERTVNKTENNLLSETVSITELSQSPQLNEATVSAHHLESTLPARPSLNSCYGVLEDIASPLLQDLECREYLKALVMKETAGNTPHINDKIEHSLTRSKKSEFSTENRYTADPLPIPTYKKKSMHSSSNCQKSEEGFTHTSMYTQGSLNFIGVNTLHESGILSEEFSQSSSSGEGISSQKIGLEVYNYVMSQDSTELNSSMNNVLRNMYEMNQQAVQKKCLTYKNNQNSNQLLELALKIYITYKEKIILSNLNKPDVSKPLRNEVQVREEGQFTCYLLKEGEAKDRELTIVKIKNDARIEVNKNNEQTFSSSSNNQQAHQKILSGLNEIYRQKSFLYCEEDDSSHAPRRDKREIIKKIENIFEEVSKDFAANKSPHLKVRRHNFADCSFERGRLVFKSNVEPRMIKINYKSALSQPKFCLIMFILAKILELLENNSKITKREIYYQIKHLVSNQSRVDSAVRAVSRLLEVGPWDLNIIAQKGLVFGNLRITMSSNEVINCNVPGTSIPQDIDEIVQIESCANFILVVEKESIFYKLLEEDLPNRLAKPFIIVTGKGFPDLNTQLFLRKLWMVMSLPVFIFADADPHGVNIMISYRFGSLANAHIAEYLALPKAKWLGVFPSEITKLDAVKQPLTENDRIYTKNILKTPYMQENSKIERELRILLESGYKTGIEGIIKNETFLSEFYFPLKFHTQDLI